MVIENVFGQSFDKPARHMREYLSILVPLLEGEQVSFAGETLRASTFGPLQIQAPAPPVLVAALGEHHAEDRRPDGLGHGHLDDRSRHHRGPHHAHHPRRRRPRPGGRYPRIGVGLPVCVTDDVDAARAKAAEVFAVYGHLPSYRAMLDREGAGGPADVAIVGSEAEVRAEIRHLADIGVDRLLRRAVRFRGRDQGIGRSARGVDRLLSHRWRDRRPTGSDPSARASRTAASAARGGCA